MINGLSVPFLRSSESRVTFISRETNEMGIRDLLSDQESWVRSERLTNSAAEAFYARHGAEIAERGARSWIVWEGA